MNNTISTLSELLTFLVKAQGYHLSNNLCRVEKKGNTYTLARGTLQTFVASSPTLEPYFTEVFSNVTATKNGQRNIQHLIERFDFLFPAVTADTSAALQALEAWAAALASPGGNTTLQLLKIACTPAFRFTTTQAAFHFTIPHSMIPDMEKIFKLEKISYHPGIVTRYQRSAKIARLLAEEIT